MQVQQQESVSASLTIPVTLGLKNQMEEISDVYSNKMVITLKSSIEKRLFCYQKDESCIIAAVLDPRFKMRWCPDDIQDHVESVVQKCATTFSSNDSINTCEEILGQPPAKKPKTDIFSFMKSKSERQRHKSSTNNEIASYLSVPCADMEDNPLDFLAQKWKPEPNTVKDGQQILGSTSIFCTSRETFQHCRQSV